MMNSRYNLLILFALTALTLSVKAQSIVLVNNETTSSIRGLSVVNNKIAWVSGSKGTVGISTDGGKTWKWPMVKGFEKADFRDIEAFSDKEAIIMSSGTPALILKTANAGLTWQIKYQNNDKAYFLDAMDFNNSRHGLVLGDPIDGAFLVLETGDGGDTWHKFSKQPPAIAGEAAFAASGTCLRAYGGNFYIVTGGSQANLIQQTGTFNAPAWHSTAVSIAHGQDSKGIFSIAMNKKSTVLVGGDYTRKSVTDSTIRFSDATLPAGKFNSALKTDAGFQSCVDYLKDDIFISSGTSGSNLTIDGGKTWNKIDETSFNVCRKAKRGNLTLLAGDGGKIGIFKF